MSDLENISEVLHDATVDLMVVDWKNVAVRVSFKLCKEGAPLVTLVMFGFTDVRLPRLEPWGSSLSVNLARITHGAPGAVNLSLQLQSGDVLTVDAESVDWLSPGSGEGSTSIGS
jgi:hypothetical protein